MRVVRMIMAAAAAVLLMLFVGGPLANAATKGCPHQMGSHQRLTDGPVVQEWTISGLRKSTDGAPGYPVAGQLWEATATVHAVAGTVTPVIPNLAAASGSEEHYPVLWQLASPAGLSGATIAEGQSATGKVYFDVTGEAPAMVIYQGGGAMPTLMWCEEAAMKSMMATMKAKMKAKSGDCCDDMAAPAGSGDCPCCADMA